MEDLGTRRLQPSDLVLGTLWLAGAPQNTNISQSRGLWQQCKEQLCPHPLPEVSAGPRSSPGSEHKVTKLRKLGRSQGQDEKPCFPFCEQA